MKPNLSLNIHLKFNIPKIIKYKIKYITVNADNTVYPPDLDLNQRQKRKKVKINPKDVSIKYFMVFSSLFILN